MYWHYRKGCVFKISFVTTFFISISTVISIPTFIAVIFLLNSEFRSNTYTWIFVHKYMFTLNSTVYTTRSISGGSI